MDVRTAVLPATTTPIAWRWVLLGGICLATLDGLFATGFWAMAADMPWTRVFQSVAAGVLGREASFAGGTPAALLGVGLHYAIAMMFVVTYTVVASRFRGLAWRPLGYGIAYGLLLYVIMNFVVIPLSAIGHLPKFDNVLWVASSVVMHAAFGVICSLSARRALA